MIKLTILLLTAFSMTIHAMQQTSSIAYRVLKKAILDEDIATIELTINANRSLLENHDFPSGNTPLLYAADNGKLKSLQKLIELGASIHAQDQNQHTLLHCAAWSNNLAMLTYVWNLNEIRKQQNAKSAFTLTPLALAANNERLEIVKFLLSRVANVDRQVFSLLNLRMRLSNYLVSGWPPLLDRDLIRLSIIRGASVTYKMRKLARKIDAEQRNHPDPHTPLAPAMRAWHAEYIASLRQDKINARRLPEIIHGDGQNGAGIIDQTGMNSFPIPIISIIQAYLGVNAK